MALTRVFVGHDPREAVAYHTFCQSVLERASVPVAFVPLAANTVAGVYERTTPHDGSNAFTYSRFLVPFLCGYEGWALFADGDMVCNADIADLFALADDSKAVMVVKHEYQTKHPTKYLGAPNPMYPRKNWSSVVLWNCGHEANRVLTPEMVSTMSGAYLHRFMWLKDEMIGSLPRDWNWLVGEYHRNDTARIEHHTLGVPAFGGFRRADGAQRWADALLRALNCEGEGPSAVVKWAEEMGC